MFEEIKYHFWCWWYKYCPYHRIPKSSKYVGTKLCHKVSYCPRCTENIDYKNHVKKYRRLGLYNEEKSKENGMETL